jgi:hypothetical protein
MKAETICPECGKKVVETCEACIASNTLIHKHGKNTDLFENIEWKITEFSKKDEHAFKVMKKPFDKKILHKKH